MMEVFVGNNSEKIALIVGGSRGIGKAIALRLAESGFNIWLTYRSNHEAAEEVKKEIEIKGRSCVLFSFDVSDHQATVDALKNEVEACAPEVVVFNAGIARDNLMMWMTKEEWDTVLTTNLDGFYNVMHVVLFPMLSAKKGRIGCYILNFRRSRASRSGELLGIKGRTDRCGKSIGARSGKEKYSC